MPTSKTTEAFQVLLCSIPCYKDLTAGSARTAKVTEVKAEIADHIMDVITKNEDEIALRYFKLNLNKGADLGDWEVLKEKLADTLIDDFIDIVELESLL